MPFIIIAFLIVYFLLCFYIAYNGWVWLKKSFQFTYKKTYFIVMLFISISFFLHHIYPFFILSWVGYIWLLVMLYSLILLPIAPMGVYAVLGNHEYYGGHIPIFLEEMNDIDVTVLVDEVINIDNLFYVVGREDYSSKDRKSIDELTHSLNKENPIFLIDHQPRELAKASAAGIDLMVSGHTHKGQLFPGNYITKAIFENHYGLFIQDDLHSIVSSGFGIWGPPFRIGSRSEIVEINVTFVD